MSMILNLRRAREHEIDLLLSHPEHVMSFLYDDEFEETAKPAGGLLSRLFGRRKEPAPVPEWEPRADDDEVDLDKAWHGLHFLFTGNAWEGEDPEGFLVNGGETIGDVEVGYGPARALRPREVERVAEFLGSLTEEELRGRYDPRRMMELKIYPEFWDRELQGGDSEFGYLLEYFNTLRTFVQDAARQGQGLILYLN